MLARDAKGIQALHKRGGRTDAMPHHSLPGQTSTHLRTGGPPLTLCRGWKYRRALVTASRPGSRTNGDSCTAGPSQTTPSEKSSRREVSNAVASARERTAASSSCTLQCVRATQLDGNAAARSSVPTRTTAAARSVALSQAIPCPHAPGQHRQQLSLRPPPQGFPGAQSNQARQRVFATLVCAHAWDSGFQQLPATAP